MLKLVIDYRQSPHNVIQPPVLHFTTLHFFYYLVLIGSFVIFLLVFVAG